MNRSDEERFHELVHKTLSKDAQPGDEMELQALISANPELKQELKQIAAESSATREILQLLEDVEHPQRTGLPMPTAKLKRRVAEVFAPTPSPNQDLVELFNSLHERIYRWPSVSDRTRATAALGALRDALFGPSIEASRIWSLDEPGLHVSHVEVANWMRRDLKPALEARLRPQELREHMMVLYGRFRELERATHECRQEMNKLIASMEKELATKERESASGEKGP